MSLMIKPGVQIMEESLRCSDRNHHFLVFMVCSSVTASLSTIYFNYLCACLSSGKCLIHLSFQQHKVWCIAQTIQCILIQLLLQGETDLWEVKNVSTIECQSQDGGEGHLFILILYSLQFLSAMVILHRGKMYLFSPNCLTENQVSISVLCYRNIQCIFRLPNLPKISFKVRATEASLPLTSWCFPFSSII